MENNIIDQFYHTVLNIEQFMTSKPELIIALNFLSQLTTFFAEIIALKYIE